MAAHAAYEAIRGLRPALTAIASAGDALGLEDRHLLHAGPPLDDPRAPPPVLLSSAVMTALHEGWASDEREAEQLVFDGAISWHPAQQFGCVTPLAATVSRNTPLFQIEDSRQIGTPSFSPVSPVLGADTRMGSRDRAVLARLRTRDEQLAPNWQRWLAGAGPLDLWSIALAGMAGGDDLHFRTTSASEALAARMAQSGQAPWITDIGKTPTYFLTLWMAACAQWLLRSSGIGAPDAIVRVGGNGQQFGLTLAGRQEQWVTEAAAAPAGPRFPGASNSPVCPAIGDSAVIDFAGFGAQRFADAPEPMTLFSDAGLLPDDFASIAEKLCLLEHPELQPPRPILVSPSRIVSHELAPFVALAMLDQTGEAGLLGRGVYRPTVDLFARALSAL